MGNIWMRGFDYDPARFDFEDAKEKIKPIMSREELMAMAEKMEESLVGWEDWMPDSDAEWSDIEETIWKGLTNWSCCCSCCGMARGIMVSGRALRC